MVESTSGRSLRPFGWTYVLYTHGDHLGHLLALFSMTPVFVIVALVTTLAQRRDLATFTMLVGQLGNELLNLILKTCIKEERPNSLHQYAPRYGMPSNHAQFMGFTAVYLTLWTIKRWKVSPLWRAAAALGLQGLAAIVIASRVYLLYHSVAQVVAGAAVGAVAGGAWFAAVELWLRPQFPAWASSSIGRLLLVRDCTDVNVVMAEYEAVMGSKAHSKLQASAASPTATAPSAVDPAPLFSPHPATAGETAVDEPHRSSGLHRRGDRKGE